ncbi:MAG: helix-turn-helix domain-containing protein [Rhodospirillales bacterium]|nr:helix-turn-helix domain-containing protein [Rhodospirillales bacterium]
MSVEQLDYNYASAAVPRVAPTNASFSRYRVVYKQPGLTLLSSDFQPAEPLIVESQTFPCVCMSIVLEGRAEGQTPNIETGFVSNEVWVASTSDRLTTRTVIMPDSPVRTVELVVTPDWFEHNECRFAGDCAFQCMRAALQRPTTVRRRRLDARLRQIAWTIHRPPRNAAMASLHFEGRTLDLLFAMAAEFDEDKLESPAGALSAQALDRIMAVRRKIDCDPAVATTIVAFAAEFGMSVSKLRQDFFCAFGICIGNYISVRRMDLGHELIERHGLSVSEAAYRAGYAHPANFTAAFRRRFGYPPSAIRI